ncbi:hypothetical protein K8T06_09110, partial [bacterium]|nr:hypothetical protein [bacterium]
MKKNYCQHSQKPGNRLGIFLVLISIFMSASAGMAYDLQMFTPETGSHADMGYYLHWQDGDLLGHSLNFYAIASGSGNVITINLVPIDAALAGFEGNEYFWDTRLIPEESYHVRVDMLDFNQHVVARDLSRHMVEIKHETGPAHQDVYVYPFMHLKNSFIMESERDALHSLLDMLDQIGFTQFEFTFNWPIAYYLENGLPDDRYLSGNIFDSAPEL